jgi:hypothetical protein
MSAENRKQFYRQPAFRGLIGVATRECTPPVGCYNRNWGAAELDVSTGVHRPLQIRVIALKDARDGIPLVYVSLELCLLRDPEETQFRRRLVDALNLPDMSRVMLHCTHTHAAVPFSFSMQDKPGGEQLAEWCHLLIEEAIATAEDALAHCREAILEWQTGSCPLAINRDLPLRWESDGRYVCGFNPEGEADQTLVVGRITAVSETAPMAILAHYACHPTTLAWQNSLISPDYIGAADELIRQHAGCPLIFMQGSAGEQSPREQYTGDVRVADRNGHVLGYSILAILENMLSAGDQYEFDRVVTSGADLGVWSSRPDTSQSRVLRACEYWMELPLLQRPTLAEMQSMLANATERPHIERIERMIRREEQLQEKESIAVPICLWQVGDSFWIGQAQEMYSQFQKELRKRFPDWVILPMNDANGPDIGYVYRPELAGLPIYQVQVSPFRPETLGLMTHFCIEKIAQWSAN